MFVAKTIIKCDQCWDILFSKYSWEFRQCKCEKTFVDETPYYTRIWWDTYSLVELPIRDVLHWRTFGKDWKQPARLVAIKDMEDDHIQAILDTQPVNDDLREIFIKELELRWENQQR